jgi:alpha-glucosidase
MYRTLTLVSALVLTCVVFGANPINIASPDGRIRFTLLTGGPRLQFAVTLDDKPVIEPSALAFTIDGDDILAGAQPGKIEIYAADQSYPTRGVHSVATDRHRGATIPLGPCILEVRAFDDGVAYRLIAAGSTGAQRTPDEASEFTLPAGATVWYHGLRGHYEGEYEKRDAAAVPAGESAAPPVVFKLPDSAGYAAITEAALVNYSGMALRNARLDWMSRHAQ